MVAFLLTHSWLKQDSQFSFVDGAELIFPVGALTVFKQKMQGQVLRYSNFISVLNLL